MRKKVAEHRAKGHHNIIITATHNFITAEIAKLFDVDGLIATRVEIKNDKLTGNYLKPACFRENKVNLLKSYLKAKEIIADEIFAYSDSINDLPLLEYAHFPCAVNADKKLRVGHSKTHCIKVSPQLPLPADGLPACGPILTIVTANNSAANPPRAARTP